MTSCALKAFAPHHGRKIAGIDMLYEDTTSPSAYSRQTRLTDLHQRRTSQEHGLTVQWACHQVASWRHVRYGRAQFVRPVLLRRGWARNGRRRHRLSEMLEGRLHVSEPHRCVPRTHRGTRKLRRLRRCPSHLVTETTSWNDWLRDLRAETVLQFRKF